MCRAPKGRGFRVCVKNWRLYRVRARLQSCRKSPSLPSALEAAEKRYSGPRKGGASAPPRRRPDRKLLNVLGRACGGAEAPPFRSAPQHFFRVFFRRCRTKNQDRKSLRENWLFGVARLCRPAEQKA